MTIKFYLLKIQRCFFKGLCAVFIAGLFLEIGTYVSCMEGFLFGVAQQGATAVFSSVGRIFSKIPGVVPPIEVWGPELFSEWMVSKDPEIYRDLSARLYEGILTKVFPVKPAGGFENRENAGGAPIAIDHHAEEVVGQDPESPKQRQNTLQAQEAQTLRNMLYRKDFNIKNFTEKWLLPSKEEFCQRFPDYLKFFCVLVGGVCESALLRLCSKWVKTSTFTPFCACFKDGVFGLMCPSFFSGGKWLVGKYAPNLNLLYNSIQQVPFLGQTLSSLGGVLFKVPVRVAFYTGIDVLLPLMYRNAKNLVWCSKETIKDCFETLYLRRISVGLKKARKEARKTS